MSHHEKIQQHFKELKSCAPADVGRHSMIILESFVVIEKKEQKEFAEVLYKWAEQHSKRKPLLFCYSKLITAFTFFYSEQYDEAFPLLNETQNSFEEQSDLNGAAVCMVFLSSIYRTFGNLDLSLKLSWASHKQLLTASSFQFFLQACDLNIGYLYFEMHHYEEAIPLFKSALEMSEASKKYYWIIYALHGLGKVYLIQKKYAEVKDCFEKAMTAAEKFNHPVSLCNSLSELGNYYFAVNDYPQAEQFHKSALSMREQHQFIGGAITSCIRLGEIYIKDSKPDEAIVFLEKGLKLAEQIKVKLKMYQIHLLLSEIYERKEELQKSLFHYKLFYELHKQVEVEDSARKLKNAQMVFEAEQTKKENIIIKKQKEEIEKKNIELQDTIDELTRAKIGKKARALTLVIAIVLFVLDDFILHFALTALPNNYFILLLVKMVIIFSLSPINKAIENYLLRKVIKKKQNEVLV